MRIRDFAGRAGRSGVTARARDERSVPAFVALLLRVVRQLGGRAGAAQSAALRPSERGVHFGGAVAKRHQRGLLLLRFLRHGVDGRPSTRASLVGADREPLAVQQTPAARRGPFVVLGRDLARRRVSRRRATAEGLHRPASLGAAWRSTWGELASGRMSDGARSHAAHRTLRPRLGRTRPPGPFALRGVTLARAQRRGVGAPPRARSRESTEVPRGRTFQRVGERPGGARPAFDAYQHLAKLIAAAQRGRRRLRGADAAAEVGPRGARVVGSGTSPPLPSAAGQR
jgi:hypothetical protein